MTDEHTLIRVTERGMTIDDETWSVDEHGPDVELKEYERVHELQRDDFIQYLRELADRLEDHDTAWAYFWFRRWSYMDGTTEHILEMVDD